MTDFLLTYYAPGRNRDPLLREPGDGRKLKSKRVSAHSKVEALRLGGVLCATFGAGSVECREIPRAR